jgi:hypothetical protein
LEFQDFALEHHRKFCRHSTSCKIIGTAMHLRCEKRVSPDQKMLKANARWAGGMTMDARQYPHNLNALQISYE